MKRFLKLLFLGLGFAWGQTLWAWGPEGHSAIGAVAWNLLSPATQSKVRTLLDQGGDTSLATIANWADEVRAAGKGQGPLTQDREAMDFNRQFPSNGAWHFINLPLGVDSIEEVAEFGSSEDVVHAINRCIRVLESPRPGEFTRPEALRLLVHFVGDIHQPLHCATGFYDLDNLSRPILITHPSSAHSEPDDRGGNDLYFGPGRSQQLHALWDSELVYQITGTPDYRGLADLLSKEYVAAVAATGGDYHDWSSSWALESAQIARHHAYQGIRFWRANSDNPRFLQLDISLPSDYVEKNKPIAAEQLAKAAARLAQLLNRIHWP